MKALMWDEHNQTLQAYCAKVMRYVDTFDKEIATTVAARRANYYFATFFFAFCLVMSGK